jgi:hypothetical protein
MQELGDKCWWLVRKGVLEAAIALNLKCGLCLHKSLCCLALIKRWKQEIPSCSGATMSQHDVWDFQLLLCIVLSWWDPVVPLLLLNKRLLEDNYAWSEEASWHDAQANFIYDITSCSDATRFQHEIRFSASSVHCPELTRSSSTPSSQQPPARKQCHMVGWRFMMWGRCQLHPCHLSLLGRDPVATWWCALCVFWRIEVVWNNCVFSLDWVKKKERRKKDDELIRLHLEIFD